MGMDHLLKRMPRPRRSSLTQRRRMLRPRNSLKKSHAPRVTRNAKPKESSLSHAPRVTRNAKPPEESSLKMDQLLRRMPRRRRPPNQRKMRMLRPRNSLKKSHAPKVTRNAKPKES